VAVVIQAALNSLLAVANNLRIFSFHSKCSFLLVWFVLSLTRKPSV